MELPFGYGKGILNDALTRVEQKLDDQQTTVVNMAQWSCGARFKYIGTQAQAYGTTIGTIGTLMTNLSCKSELIDIVFDGCDEPQFVPVGELEFVGEQ